MKKNKRKVSPIAVGIVIAVVCLALVLVFKPEQAIGSAVYVNYYGVSDQPLAEGAGKIQTYVKLSKETIKGLGNKATQTDKEITNNILETADFAHGLMDIYEANPPAPVQTSKLDVVMDGAELLADNLRTEKECINKIGDWYSHEEEFEFVVVTELMYHPCSDEGEQRQHGDWLGAKASHVFYDMDGKEICAQESYPLFTVSKGTGDINSNIAGC
ncbi:hypothetical protein KY317_03105 [Candidatus Woesearchaeota archaeon]|nr:hypothetical protein [Candidatus Woesearchaeota archaeon]